jgi:signal transduction histidine kinase
MNYSYLLSRMKLGPLTDKQKQAAARIEAVSRRLADMVRQYLNLSRIENGEMTPVPVRFQVRPAVLEPLLEVMEADIAARNMKVTNSVGQDIFVHADANMAREVFENLIGNAVKYGRDGGHIVIEARDRENMVEFSVKNEGESIPENKRVQVFEKFSRLQDPSQAAKRRGTGLGLFIAKQIVESHGGTIGVASVPDGWTEFVFTLPRSAEEPESSNCID